MRNKVLKPALLVIAQGGPKKPNFDDKAADVHIDAFEARVDAVFFEELFDALDLDTEQAEARWSATLFELASDVKKRAEGALPLPVARRYRALAAGDRAFIGSAIKQGFRRSSTDIAGGPDESANA